MQFIEYLITHFHGVQVDCHVLNLEFGYLVSLWADLGAVGAGQFQADSPEFVLKCVYRERVWNWNAGDAERIMLLEVLQYFLYLASKCWIRLCV